jgi:hypothetical protein
MTKFQEFCANAEYVVIKIVFLALFIAGIGAYAWHELRLIVGR